MFNFHKPKIYRSTYGCCICKAKSSSSRFTDSKKYETEFERCFLIKEIRTGEICNACVLLVKRCKKLPKDTTKNWSHVVDARQGHKSNNKAKISNQNPVTNNSASSSSSRTNKSKVNKKAERKVCEKLFINQNLIANENDSTSLNTSEEELKIVQNTSITNEECDCLNCVYNRGLDELEKNNSSNNQQLKVKQNIRRLKKTSTPKKLCTETASNSTTSGNSSDSSEEDEEYISDDDRNLSTKKKLTNNQMVTRSGNLVHSYTANSSDCSSRKLANDQQSINKSSSKSKNKRKFAVKHIQRSESTFLDMNYWKREEVCCGIIFRNKTNDMVLIDPWSKLFNPCACRKKKADELKKESNDNKMDLDQQSSLSSTDKNNNFLSSQPTTSTPIKKLNDQNEKTEKITVNLDNLITDDNQLNDSINNPINELVIVNSSSGISSDSSDISSIEEEDVEEDSNSSSNSISKHNLIAKNMIVTNRTFGVL